MRESDAEARLPLPSSNRTCGFPASGFHANSRCRALRRPKSQLSAAAKPRSKMRTGPHPCGWFSVGGLTSKRNSHPLTQRVCVPAPSLQGGDPLLRYGRPVRLPHGADSRVMHCPQGVGGLAWSSAWKASSATCVGAAEATASITRANLRNFMRTTPARAPAGSKPSPQMDRPRCVGRMRLESLCPLGQILPVPLA